MTRRQRRVAEWTVVGVVVLSFFTWLWWSSRWPCSRWPGEPNRTRG